MELTPKGASGMRERRTHPRLHIPILQGGYRARVVLSLKKPARKVKDLTDVIQTALSTLKDIPFNSATSSSNKQEAKRDQRDA